MQRTCCQRTEILVTSGDVARIERHVAREDGAFHEWREPPDPAYVEHDERDPRWLELTVRADGKRHVLAQEPNGDCTFLGPEGCTLSREVRPLICRLYPLRYSERGVEGEAAEYCPIAVLQPPEGSMALLLGMEELEIRRWHAMLYEELEEDLERDEGRPHLRSA
jgi:Fe-S-cluster containining protein